MSTQGTWISSHGKEIPLQDMAERYLVNAIKLLQGAGARGTDVSDQRIKLPALLTEAQRRGIDLSTFEAIRRGKNTRARRKRRRSRVRKESVSP